MPRLSYSDPCFPAALVPPQDMLESLDVYQGGSYRAKDLDGQSLAFIGEAYAQLMEERLEEALTEGAPAELVDWIDKQIRRGRRLSRRFV